MREETLINAVNDIDDIRCKLEDIHQNIMEQPDYWEKLHHQAAIAAMPIADSIVDKLDSSKHHREDGCYGMHSIDLFVEECIGIATTLVNKLKEEQK